MFDVVFWLAQLIGAIGLVFSILSAQAKTRQKMLTLQMWSSVIYFFHYAFLIAWIGALLNAVVVWRNWVFIQKGAWARHIGWMWFFMALSVGTLFFSWEGWISILPVIGLLVGVWSRFHDNSAAVIRLYSLVGAAVWLPYNVVVDSYAGTISTVIGILAILYGMWTHDRKPPVSNL